MPIDKGSKAEFHRTTRHHLDLAGFIRKKVAAVTIAREIEADVRSSKQGPKKKGIKGARPQARKAEKFRVLICMETSRLWEDLIV